MVRRIVRGRDTDGQALRALDPGLSERRLHGATAGLDGWCVSLSALRS